MLPEYAYNLFHSGKWLVNIPFKQIYTDLSTPYVSFNLQKLTLPDFEIRVANFAAKGDILPVPTFTRQVNKRASFTCLLSSNWHQYSILYRWFNNVATINSTPSTTNAGYLLDLDVNILSEFKKPMFAIILEKSFITRISKVEMDYVNSENEVPFTFEVAFQMMRFDDRFPNHNLNQG